MIGIKHLQINHISALNNPYGVDMPLHQTKSKIKKIIYYI